MRPELEDLGPVPNYVPSAPRAAFRQPLGPAAAAEAPPATPDTMDLATLHATLDTLFDEAARLRGQGRAILLATTELRHLNALLDRARALTQHLPAADRPFIGRLCPTALVSQLELIAPLGATLRRLARARTRGPAIARRPLPLPATPETPASPEAGHA